MAYLDYQERTEKPERTEGDELFSVPVKAGKRIYYFDVKATRNDDYYITVTESRKRLMKDGSFVIDKHKIHLYKEDFEKFANGLQEAIAYIKEHKGEAIIEDGMITISEEEFFKNL